MKGRGDARCFLFLSRISFPVFMYAVASLKAQLHSSLVDKTWVGDTTHVSELDHC